MAWLTGDDPLAGDRALVQGMLAGEEPAFELFADDYIPRIYRFVGSRLSGRPELVAEIVQSTICKAIAKLDSWRGEASLTTWLCACARFEIALHFRSEGRQPQFVELAEGTTPGHDWALGQERDQEDAALQEESRRRIHRVLDELPGQYGRVLEMKYLEELPVKEIARRLDATPKATESLLTRARRAFREAHDRLEETPRVPLIVPSLRPSTASTP